MADFPSKVRTHTSTPGQGGGGSSLRPDLSFLRSVMGVLMLVEIVVGLVVWALIADTPYYYYAIYDWVMFVAVFLWVVTIIFFIIYLWQLHFKLSMVPWPLVLMIFNISATILYITGFISCAIAVRRTSITGSYTFDKRAAASFFACVVMIIYGVSAFFSFQAWKGSGSNAATSQMAGGYS